MTLLNKIIKFSSLKEPFAGGEVDFDQQIQASLPFLQLIPKKKHKVLVIGCGDGYEVKWLMDQGFAAWGVTNNSEEVKRGREKYGVDLQKGDIHQLPFKAQSFDCLYAANILEHSVAPYVALREWRRVLRHNGWLIIVMPSQEWLRQYYHFSVLTHSQMKDLLVKAGFKLLAGPEVKPKIALNKGDIFYDLGRGWGHYDGYIAQKVKFVKQKFMLGEVKKTQRPIKWPLQLIKVLIKKPYNLIRVWFVQHHHE